MEGSIARIKLENFVTYSSLEVCPGNHLNVIIGPNGTGKSSLVSAICLGLAGKTSVLSRAAQASEFIKHGTESATIEIELRGTGRNHVVQRTIRRSGPDLWVLDGAKVNLKKVEEFTRSLKIQVSNLCQFLPQDKVADFAKMSQQDLLENTEMAVDEKLYHAHQELKSARGKERELKQEFERSEELLEVEKEKNERLEPDVESYKLRKSHLEEVDLLTKKRYWVEYETSRQQLQAKKEAKIAIEGRLKVAKKEHAPLIAKRDVAKENERQLSCELQAKQQRIQKTQQETANLLGDKTKLQDSLEDAKAELKTHMDDEQKREQKITDMETQINDLEGEMRSVAEIDLQPEMDSVSTRIREVTHLIAAGSLEAKNTHLHGLEEAHKSAAANLRLLMNIHNQKLEVLRKASQDAHAAAVWLQSNQHQFEYEIIGPIMLTLNIKEKGFAKYLESHIPRRDLVAFVCQSANDQNTLLKLVRDDQDLRINTVLAPKVPLQPSANLDRLRRFGFQHNLGDLFECPDPVMAYLQQMYKVHAIPVGDHSSYNKVQEIMNQEKNLKKFYTENHQFSVHVSRYGNHNVSTNSSELGMPKLLGLTTDTQRENFLKKQIQTLVNGIEAAKEEIRDLMQKQRQLECNLEELRAQKKELMNKRNDQRQLSQKIQMKKDQVDRLRKSAVNVDQLKSDLEQRAKVLRSKMTAVLKNMTQKISLHLALSIDRSLLKLDLTCAQAERNEYEAEIREKASALQTLETELQTISEEVQRLKLKAKSLLADAKKAVGIAAQENLSQAQLTSFQPLPNTIQELTAAIYQAQARADCATSQNANVLEEYNQRKTRIERLRKETDDKKEKLTLHQETIQATRENWLHPLNQLLGRINENFSNFFQSMNCAGEVDLKVPDQQDDYEKYGIRIKVQYRDNESLRELTAQHQSGGERSVATVLYVMSLQSLTQVPFRCVDEINQGMDPHNERRVFEIIMNTVCSQRNSQYFLLTPKLLPDLEYDNNTTIHCIYNGTIVHHKKINVDKFIARRAKFD